MAKLTYHDADKNAPEVEVYGKKLKDGESVEIPDEDAARYRNNKYFKVSGGSGEHDVEITKSSSTTATRK